MEEDTGGGRIRRLIRKRPIASFSVVTALSLFIGLAIGLAASEDERIAEAEKQAAAAEEQAEELETELADARAEIEELATQLDDLLEEGEVPDFTGMRIAEARDHEFVDRYGWTIQTERRPTDRAEGTVLEQRPQAGRSLARGQSIRLVIATERPPEWQAVFEVSGAGSTRTDEFELTSDRVRIRYSFTGGTNAILQLRQPGDTFGELLLNEIGDYEDTTRVYTDPGTYYLEIEGGNWSVTVEEER